MPPCDKRKSYKKNSQLFGFISDGDLFVFYLLLRLVCLSMCKKPPWFPYWPNPRRPLQTPVSKIFCDPCKFPKKKENNGGWQVTVKKWNSFRHSQCAVKFEKKVHNLGKSHCVCLNLRRLKSMFFEIFQTERPWRILRLEGEKIQKMLILCILLWGNRKSLWCVIRRFVIIALFFHFESNVRYRSSKMRILD